MKKGTMQPVKQILGGACVISGVIHLLNLNFEIPKSILAILLLVSGYFLYIAGRQR